MGNPLVELIDYEPQTTSLKVAELFGKEHFHVTRDIRDLDCSQEFRASNFGAAEFTDKQGKKRRMFNMTRDGFSFTVMGYVGSKAAQFKEEFITEFNRMSKALAQASIAVRDERIQVLEARISLLAPIHPAYQLFEDMLYWGPTELFGWSDNTPGETVLMDERQRMVLKGHYASQLHSSGLEWATCSLVSIMEVGRLLGIREVRISGKRYWRLPPLTVMRRTYDLVTGQSTDWGVD